MKKTRLPLLLAVGYALLLPCLSPADTVVEEIIARVNNEIITRSEYIRSRDQVKQEVQQQDPANADRAFTEKQRDVLRDLIDQQLLLQKGKDLGITGDTELIKRLDEMRKQMNLEPWRIWKKRRRRRELRMKISSRICATRSSRSA
jgi:peptidyl-prolyl cis-trans isomerase SurA